MRGLSLLVCASGCLSSTAAPFEPPPDAQSAVIVDERFTDGAWHAIYGFVAEPRELDSLPLNIGSDDRISLLSYSQPPDVLQLEKGVLLPQPGGVRPIPRPDLGIVRLDAPISDSDWIDIDELPDFPLPEYSMSRCAEAGLCLEAESADLCSACSSVSTPTVAEPLPVDVVPEPPHQSCRPGHAHFFGESGCVPVGASCPALPFATQVSTDLDLILAVLAHAPQIALAPRRFHFPGWFLKGPLEMIGCGPESIIELPRGSGLIVYGGNVRLANFRIEGGIVGIAVGTNGVAEVEDVSIDADGYQGIYNEGELHARRLSIEGRAEGARIGGGTATFDQLVIHDAPASGVFCLGARTPEVHLALRDFVIRDTATNPASRAIFGGAGCHISIDGGLIENGRRAGVELYDDTSHASIRGLTIRNIAADPEPGFGGIVVREEAHLELVEDTWVEHVYGAGIQSTDPNTVLRNVHVEGVLPLGDEPAYGIRLVVLPGYDGVSTIDRAFVRGVADAPIEIRGTKYEESPAMTRLSDLTIEARGTRYPMLLLHRVDAVLERARFTGGTDGLTVTNGADSYLRDLSFSVDRNAITLEADTKTGVSIENVAVSRAAIGVHALGRFDPNVDNPLRKLVAASIDVRGCSDYGLLIEGVPSDISYFTIRDNRVGVGISSGQPFHFRSGEISNNRFGARVVDGLNLRELLVGVRFFGNTRSIETAATVP